VLQRVAACCSVMCCSMLHGVAVSQGSGKVEMLQRVAACCSVLQCSVLQRVAACCCLLQCVAVCCSVLHSVALWSSVLQCVALCCIVLHCVAVFCSVLQGVALCCSELQCRRARGPCIMNWIFSKVSILVILHSVLRSKLTFENFCLAGHRSRSHSKNSQKSTCYSIYCMQSL